MMLLTPPNTHLDLVRQVARAGKHVLLEKPLEISLDRSLQLVEAAEQKGSCLASSCSIVTDRSPESCAR